MSDEASKLKGLCWVIATIAFATVFAVGLSPLIRMVPWRWEQALADYTGPVKTANTCIPTPKADQLLKQLVARLYPTEPDDTTISINVKIVDDPVVNAYASLGGNIAINNGLLRNAKTADEVAGVLAHEIEHVKRRHILENAAVHMLTIGSLQMIFSGQPPSSVEGLHYFLNMNFSRHQESEADEGGLHRLQTAHVSNEGFRDFFKRMEDSSLSQTLLSNHPDNQDRYAMAETFDNKDTRPIITHEEWLTLKNYCR